MTDLWCVGCLTGDRLRAVGLVPRIPSGSMRSEFERSKCRSVRFYSDCRLQDGYVVTWITSAAAPFVDVVYKRLTGENYRFLQPYRLINRRFR